MPRRAEAGRMRERACCCAQAVSGAAVGLLLTWFQYGLMFRPYPPGCYFIQEEVIVSQADDGTLLNVTDAPAIIHSYVETPGLKVQYENIRAILKLGEGVNVELITRPIELPDVDLRYERFYAWKIRFNGSVIVPLHPGKNLSSSGPLTLEITMKMPWYSSWSVRWGIFHSVKITCPFDPNSIRTPVKCVVTS